MISRLSRLATACLAASFVALQTPAVAPQSQSVYSPGAVPYNLCEDLPIPPTPGRPFRAALNARRVENRLDGSTVVYESHCIVGRDENGRTLSVALPSTPVALPGGGTASVVGTTVVLDPVTRIVWRWDEEMRVARQLRPETGQLNVSTTFNARCGQDPVATVPSLLNSRRFEPLGDDAVQGIVASGCRVTTVPRGAPESDAYVYESWTSSDLGIEVLRRRRDGRASYEETMSLDDLHREAPSAGFFHPPADYPVRTLDEELRVAEQARPRIARPSSLAGRWETDVDAAGIVDGLLLTLSIDPSEGDDRLTSLSIGVYRRENGEESLGYFVANEGPVKWDGTRLRIMFDPGRRSTIVDVDVTFDEPGARWTGVFGRNRDVRTVELRRPGGFSRAPATDRIVGAWCDTGSSNTRPAGRCITLAQGSDRVLRGWLDRCCEGVTRYGEALAISRTSPDSIELTLVSAGGNQHGFVGSLSPDGKSIEGSWLFNRMALPATTLRRTDVVDLRGSDVGSLRE